MIETDDIIALKQEEDTLMDTCAKTLCLLYLPKV